MQVNRLADLNSDVLRHICDYLSGRDALHFSLTAKDFHELAITRVGVSFTPSHATDDLFLFLRSGMHPGVPPRTQYLRNLVITPRLFILAARDMVQSLSSDEEDGEKGESVHGSGLRRGLTSSLLVELLSGACHLRSLTLAGVHALMHGDSRFAAALAALAHLHHVAFESVNDTVVKFVGQTGWDLRTLHLDYLLRRHFLSPFPGESTRTVLVLYGALAQFHNLHTLKIAHFESFPVAPTNPIPVFPSIRRLFIASDLTLSVFDLVDRCPKVHLVDLSECTVRVAELDHRDRRFKAWPALRSLRVPSNIASIAEGSADRVVLGWSVADHLQVAPMIRAPTREDESSSDVQSLLWTLGGTSPMYVQLSVAVKREPMNFWGRVAECAPRLRYLELKVSILDLDEQFAGWVVRSTSS